MSIQFPTDLKLQLEKVKHSGKQSFPAPNKKEKTHQAHCTRIQWGFVDPVSIDVVHSSQFIGNFVTAKLSTSECECPWNKNKNFNQSLQEQPEVYPMVLHWDLWVRQFLNNKCSNWIALNSMNNSCSPMTLILWSLLLL